MNRGILCLLLAATWCGLASEALAQGQFQPQGNGYQQPGYQQPNNGYPPQNGYAQPSTAGVRRDPERPPAIPPADAYVRMYPQGFHPYMAIPRRCTACECCNDPYPPCADPTSWTFLDCLCDLNTELWHGVLDPCCAMDCCQGSRCHNRSFGLLDLSPWHRREKLAQRHGCGGPPGGPGIAGVGGCNTCGGSGFLHPHGYGSPDGYVGCLEQYHVPRGWIPPQPIPTDLPGGPPQEFAPLEYAPSEMQPSMPIQPGQNPQGNQPVYPRPVQRSSFGPQPEYQFQSQNQGRPDPRT